jgi:hypothetical protein
MRDGHEVPERCWRQQRRVKVPAPFDIGGNVIRQGSTVIPLSQQRFEVLENRCKGGEASLQGEGMS